LGGGRRREEEGGGCHEVGTAENAVYLIASLKAVLQLTLSLDDEKSRMTALAGFLLQQHELFDARIL
jgi:hypothetical protein